MCSAATDRDLAFGSAVSPGPGLAYNHSESDILRLGLGCNLRGRESNPELVHERTTSKSYRTVDSVCIVIVWGYHRLILGKRLLSCFRFSTHPREILQPRDRRPATREVNPTRCHRQKVEDRFVTPIALIGVDCRPNKRCAMHAY
jgi:hypothetical protein